MDVEHRPSNLEPTRASWPIGKRDASRCARTTLAGREEAVCHDHHHDEIQALVDEMGGGVQAWVNGRLEHTAATHMVQAQDMTIFGPFGGQAARNGPEFEARQARVVHGGSSKCELVHAMTSGDLVVLVMVERSAVTFEGRDKPQTWVLRTTQVFRKEGDRWLRLHRHADPLIKLRSFDETLELAADVPAV